MTFLSGRFWVGGGGWGAKSFSLDLDFRFYSILVTKLQGFIQKTNICQGIVPRYYRGCSNIT